MYTVSTLILLSACSMLLESAKLNRKYVMKDSPRLEREKRRILWKCKVKRNVIDIDCRYFNTKENLQSLSSRETFDTLINNNNQYDTEIDKISKSSGSKDINAIKPVAGPRGPAGPPGVLVLDKWIEALDALKETKGRIKDSKRSRSRFNNGPVLNVVFNSNPLENSNKWKTSRKIGDLRSELQSQLTEGGGFHTSLRSDIFLQRLSRLQISNFNKPKPSSTSFSFLSTSVEFNHKSGSLMAYDTGIYTISATLNILRMLENSSEKPEFEDNITARVCLDDECLYWDLETRIAVTDSKYLNLKLTGIVRIEEGKNVFLFVENNSSLNFRIMKGSTFSGYLLSPAD